MYGACRIVADRQQARCDDLRSEFADTFLYDGSPPLAKSGGLGGIDVDSDDSVASGSETRGRDAADVSESEHAQHGFFCSGHVDLAVRFHGSVVLRLRERSRSRSTQLHSIRRPGVLLPVVVAQVADYRSKVSRLRRPSSVLGRIGFARRGDHRGGR